MILLHIFSLFFIGAKDISLNGHHMHSSSHLSSCRATQCEGLWFCNYHLGFLKTSQMNKQFFPIDYLCRCGYVVKVHELSCRP